MFSPVRRVNFTVAMPWVGEPIMTVLCSRSGMVCDAQDAVAYAAEILKNSSNLHQLR